jgi:hypothetical protein
LPHHYHHIQPPTSHPPSPEPQKGGPPCRPSSAAARRVGRRVLSPVECCLPSPGAASCRRRSPSTSSTLHPSLSNHPRSRRRTRRRCRCRPRRPNPHPRTRHHHHHHPRRRRRTHRTPQCRCNRRPHPAVSRHVAPIPLVSRCCPHPSLFAPGQSTAAHRDVDSPTSLSPVEPPSRRPRRATAAVPRPRRAKPDPPRRNSPPAISPRRPLIRRPSSPPAHQTSTLAIRSQLLSPLAARPLTDPASLLVVVSLASRPNVPCRASSPASFASSRSPPPLLRAPARVPSSVTNLVVHSLSAPSFLLSSAPAPRLRLNRPPRDYPLELHLP